MITVVKMYTILLGDALFLYNPMDRQIPAKRYI